MNILKAIGAALIAALVTALTLFGGFIFAIVSTIVTVVFGLCMLLGTVYYLVWESMQNKDKTKQ